MKEKDLEELVEEIGSAKNIYEQAQKEEDSAREKTRKAKYDLEVLQKEFDEAVKNFKKSYAADGTTWHGLTHGP